MTLAAGFDLIRELLPLSSNNEDLVKLVYDQMKILLMMNELVLLLMFLVKLDHLYIIHQMVQIILFYWKFLFFFSGKCMSIWALILKLS
jgi:hypothetical protein